MTAVNNLPDYQDLFGELDFKSGDPARSVYSPAAYLADLLQLIDDVFTDPDLRTRRPDIDGIPLDEDRTFTLVPYLDIVNEQLERLTAEDGADAYDVLRSARSPLGLPFDLDDARTRLLLRFLAVRPDEIRRLFAADEDPMRTACDVMGLSAARGRIVTQAVTVDRAFIEANFPGLPAGTSSPVAQKLPVADVLSSTGLSPTELRALLGSALSATALNAAGRPETDRAGELFVNHGLDGFAQLDADEEHVVWSDGRRTIDPQWFDRVNRLVRLSRWTGRSLSELDRFLRCCCRRGAGSGAPSLDVDALITLAVATRLTERTDLGLAAVGVLFGDIDDLGMGDGDRPVDPFNSLFNGRHAEVSHQLVVVDPGRPGDTHRPLDVVDMDVIQARGDLLSVENKAFRRRISRSFGVSESVLVGLVEGIRAHWADLPDTGPLDAGVPVDRRALSLIARVLVLCEILDVTHGELFTLLDVLERDPSIRRFSNFALLIDPHPSEMDGYRILAGNDHRSSLWLVQTLVAIGDWMGRHDLDATGIARVVGAGDVDDPDAARERRIQLYDAMVEQFVAQALSSDDFRTASPDERAARVVHATVVAPDAGLVSPSDDRIVRFDAARARAAAHRALDDLDVVHDDDFVGLGLGERVVDWISDNLVIRSVIDPDGLIRPDAVPASADDFPIDTDFGPVGDAVFDVIHELVRAEQASAELGDDIDVSVYESDLTGLGLHEAEVRELYGTLVHQGFLGQSGEVLDTSIFATPESRGTFGIERTIAPFASTVHAVLAEKLRRFEESRLTVDPALFADLGLTEQEVDDLVDNLRFNGYLDDDSNLVDKAAITSIDVADLSLALPFYPHRHAILAALVAGVEQLRALVAALGPDDLFTLGEAVASQSVADAIRRDHCVSGRLTPTALAFFSDRANLSAFDVGRAFDRAAHEAVFDAVARFVTAADGVRLTARQLDGLALDPAGRADLRRELRELDAIDESGRVSMTRLDEFVNVNNALSFRLGGFPDDSMDVFFMLHSIAVETVARVDSVVAALQGVSERQADWLLATLQEHFEIAADVVEVICRHVFDTSRLVEAWMLPLLEAVDADGRLADEPPDRWFRDAHRRTGQFAALATRLGLDATATEVVFRDQTLAEKYPEPLDLPADIDGFDALIELDVEATFVGGTAEEPPVAVIVIFRDDRLWAYAADTHELVVTGVPLSSLSTELAEVPRVDAAFTDADGTSWIITGTTYLRRAVGDDRWSTADRSFGEVRSNFTDPDHLDAAFTDHEGRTYLFAGDQYVRYSGSLDVVDEGYPRRIAGNWAAELEIVVPEEFLGRIDAAFQAADETTYLFHGEQFVSSEEPGEPRPTREHWGLVRNNFTAGGEIDAAMSDGSQIHLFSGDQMVSYSNSLENDGVSADEGSLRSLSHLPAPFDDGVDAAFRGPDDTSYLFAGELFVTTVDDEVGAVAEIRDRWGRIRNTIQERGTIDAALTGLDGRTYLFSGDQYVRYSGTRYTHVDEGYPRRIAPDWGGLQRVDAAVVLDGKTYLFGAVVAPSDDEHEHDDEGESESRGVSGLRTYAVSDDGSDGADGVALVYGYVRYSSNDYRAADEGYPRPTDDNWWNLPDALVRDGFANPDAVFVGSDEEVHLFSGGRFIRFDALHRWWSEPESLDERWDSIPFSGVDAAFTGKDGRAYLFSGDSFVRYSGPAYDAVDDRYPKSIAAEWGVVDSAIERSGSIDAAVVVEAHGDELQHTYLFSDRQFYRYTTDGGSDMPPEYAQWVDEGYPRAIATALADEPRFANLTADLATGVRAAAADRRTIYLVGREQAQAVSDTLYREYRRAFPQSVGTAVIDEGVVYVHADGWHRAAGLEAGLGLTPSARPPVLRGFPDDIDRPDAVLIGTDGATYAFQGGRCHDDLLDRTYPAGEEWGRERNRIEQEGRVDAALTGRDGKLHLFRGDEFVTYSVAIGQSPPATVDVLPQPIVERWGGLTNVHLAFVRGDTTYLTERPDDEGRFRYVRYSGEDYDEPDAGFPALADHSWWEIPEMYVDEGFDRVDAVLAEGDDLFLFRGDEFVHFDAGAGIWTYPRPIERIWRDLWAAGDEHPDVTAVMSAPAPTTTFFLSDGTFVTTGGSGDPATGAIADRWGVVENSVRTGRIDAALAHPDGTTYVFSGGQYVRYSGPDYRFVDAGYPKSIVDHLREEPPFANLPAELMVRLDGLFADGGGLDAVIANSRTVYLVEQGNLHVCSQSATAPIDLGRIGSIKNNLAETGTVDATLRTPDGATYVFSGDQYVRYSDGEYDLVDAGYPRSLLAAEPGWPALLEVDAAFSDPDGTTYLCAGTSCAAIRDGQVTWTTITERWGRARNVFTTHEGNTTIDAAFVGRDDSLYVFKGDQYVRHTNSVDNVVAEGYPRAIVDDFGDLPVAYEDGVDGAFTLAGRTYFVRRSDGDDERPPGREYVRFSDPDLTEVDAISPQPFVHRWGSWNDHLLTDLHTISRFASLDAHHAGADTTLAELLDASGHARSEPYVTLADLFGWDVDEAIWLKRMNAFLVPENRFEVAFDLELILKMHDVFTVADRLHSAPRELYEKVWRPLFETGDLEAVAQMLQTLLGSSVSESDWAVLSRQLHDEMNTMRRDALLPYVLSITGFASSRDLYEHLLIDPEVESCSETSRVKEAITAVQLYLHRYFVNLEELDAAGTDDEPTRRRLKSWWRWMRNYRVWEANRKVFLYPENYIRPELRDTKTPAFATLEEDLLQGELDDGLVQRSFRKYLDHYTEVSRLQIAGGYVYDDADRPLDKRLILFGRTKTDPRVYYYRTALFPDGDSSDAQWGPWLETKIQIDSTKVYPVHAFGRVFVFWATVEQQIQDSDASSGTVSMSENADGDQEFNNSRPAEHVVRIWYSFHNLNHEWTPPQALDTRIDPRVGDADDDGVLDEAAVRSMQMREPLPIAAVKLYVENSDRLDQHDFENIVVNCGYEVRFPAPPPPPPGHQAPPTPPPMVRQHSFVLTPELYSKRANRPHFAGSGVELLRGLFEGEAITDSRVVALNTHENSIEGPWYSFEHKGGSFLVKPEMGSANVEFGARPDHVPGLQHIDAAVEAGGTQYFFDNHDMTYATSGPDGPGPASAIGSRWGLRPSAIQRDDRVDAALHVRGADRTYLFRGGEYIVYAGGDYRRTTPESPMALSKNRDGLPSWDHVDAAFEVPNGRRFFFDNKRGRFAATDTAGRLAAPQPTKRRWGKRSNVFTRRDARVTAAFEVGEVVLPNEKTKRGAVYLVNGERFVRYRNQLSAFVDNGFPKRGGAKAILEDIGFTEVDASLAGAPVEAAYRLGDVIRLYLADKRLAECDVKDWTVTIKNVQGGAVRAAYRNNEAKPQLLRSDRFDATLATGGRFYVFKGTEFMESNEVPASFDAIEFEPTGRIADRFGRQKTRIAETGTIDAAVEGQVDGVAKLYLFSGDEYVRYGFDNNGNPKEFIDSGYPKKIAANTEGFPAWTGIGAAFRDQRGRAHFFELDGTKYTDSSALARSKPIRDQWGLIPTDVTENGVAAAFVTGDKLYLVSRADPTPPEPPWFQWWRWRWNQPAPVPPRGAEYVCYTLRNGRPGRTIDAGYPKHVDSLHRRINAAFPLGDTTYLFFEDGYYASLPADAEPDRLPSLRQIKGNWGNLPVQFASDLDAALVWTSGGSASDESDRESDDQETDDEGSDGDGQRDGPSADRLTLFSGDQALTYDLHEAAPYELRTADFEVTRLTTSTGYVLNERLFAGGVDALLSLQTQQTDEVPALDPQQSTPTRIRFDATRIKHPPIDSHLDFFSANGIYYWEVFFHAPLLIASALNTAQRFEDAKRWYEFVYDPTEANEYWAFLPFLSIDIEGIVASMNGALEALEAGSIQLRSRVALTEVSGLLTPMEDGFRGLRRLDRDERTTLRTGIPTRLGAIRSELATLRGQHEAGAAARALETLDELSHMIESLDYRYELLQTRQAQLRAYLDDPFDPHAIAGARRIAYRKATVMAYVDNLLDWGDMLFRRYTVESISEARMLYVLAYDLLGRAPASLGNLVLTPSRSYDGPGEADGLRDARDAGIGAEFDPAGAYDFLVELEEGRRVRQNSLPYEPTVHDSIVDSYFFIPDNERFVEYWDRVEDRLHKIRNCLNIMGIEQPLPLFQPPIDPMALVQAVGSGVPLSQAITGVGTSIPHYRFSFVLAKARELTQRVSQFGNELLQTLEKRDAEALSMMQYRQEAVILSMTRGVREAQLAEVETSIESLRESHRNAVERAAHYDRLISTGMNPSEITQLSLMAAGAAAQYASVVIKALGGIMYLLPEVKVGLFSFGAELGGVHAGEALSSAGDSVQTVGEALSMTGEALGVRAAFERMVEEWQLQKLVTDSEIVQLEAQIRGAEFQRKAAQRELEILDREIEHNESITSFMRDKFTNEQLYQWMTSRLSTTYFQTYKLAHDMARYAEQAFRYERGLPASGAAFIQPAYWDSQRKGLTAGDALGLDIDRMEQSFIETDERRLEISRNFSLLEIDPMALMTLRSTGSCEFRLAESLFDYDFPGHYCRQIKTISLSFDMGDGSETLATLTQLHHQTVLQPDPKAVKHLLDPANDPPTSIRSDWRANQQIALSHIDEYDKNNGMFELRFDDDRYLPFEGTGAVSAWRLTFNGRRGSYDASTLQDVVVNVKYSAIDGGRAFGTAVRGLLKPYLTGVLVDLADGFPDAWAAFKSNGATELALPVTRDMFPDMAASKIVAIYTHFERRGDGPLSMVVNGDDELTLDDGSYLETPGLAVASGGSEWSLSLDGDKALVDNVQLVIIYKASVK